MVFEDFKKHIEAIQFIDNYRSKLYELGIDVENKELDSAVNTLAFGWVLDLYGEEGHDWVTWWLYELPGLKKRHGEREAFAYNPDGSPINLDTIDDLYKFLEELK